MKTFVLKVFLFSIPFLLLVLVELLIDPFNYFSEEKNTELLNLKEDISQKSNPYLYKLITYDRYPYPIIILGDSRSALLSPSYFDYSEKDKVANLAIGGGNLQDAIEIFRYVSSKHYIKKVYWGISFEGYNGTRLRNRAQSSIEIKNSFLMYLFNRYTFSATALICKSLIFDEKIDLYKPPFTKEVFWQNQLVLAERYLKNYSYPLNYYNDLREISEFCLVKNIKLIFVISPTHIELQNKIKQLNLADDYSKFKCDIGSFGDLYDFNYPNIITSNKNNFKDPFHHTDSVSRIIVKDLLTKGCKYSKYAPQIRINENE
jgi:hypothetical protein